MNLQSALQLGRISNLPTVWTNVLVGALLAGGAMADARLPLLIAAMSFFYIGGMFLNDAFDSDFDAQYRPDRPIPSGRVSVRHVFVWGFGLLAAGLVLVAVASRGNDGLPRWQALASGLGLGVAIVIYDMHHKGNALSPLVMGLCRVFVVTTAAFALSAVLTQAVVLAALALLCHLIGLTYVAKQEHLNRLGALWPLGFLAVPSLYGLVLATQSPRVWPLLILYLAMLGYALMRLKRRARGDVPRAVVTLIAGMSLLDAMVLAGAAHLTAAGLALAAFVLTLMLQRWVAGT